MDDCLASNLAIATLAPYFQLRDFRVVFPDAKKGKQNGVLDTPVIKKCHDEKWLLLTTDHEMLKTHIEEIKKHPNVTILAATHNSATPEDNVLWLQAVIKLRASILRLYKKQPRPWFATFSREGTITNFKVITAEHKTRRTRPK